MNHPVGHTLRPINHNNTQHFKGNQRAEQHHLLYKTIKYFNCYSTVADRPSFAIGVDYEVVEDYSECPLTAIFPLPVHWKTGNSIQTTLDRDALRGILSIC